MHLALHDSQQSNFQNSSAVLTTIREIQIAQQAAAALRITLLRVLSQHGFRI